MTDTRAISITPVFRNMTSEEREQADGPSGALLWMVIACLLLGGTFFGFGIYKLVTLI